MEDKRKKNGIREGRKRNNRKTEKGIKEGRKMT